SGCVREGAVNLRAPTIDDVQALVAFSRDLHDRYGAGGENEGEFRDLLTSPILDAEKDMRIWEADGRVAGWVDVFDLNRAHERLFIDCRVEPREARLYAPLLDWAEGRARQIAGGRDARARAGVHEGDGALVGGLERRGYRFIRHFFRMEIDLTDDLPKPDWPPGISVRTFRDEDAQAVFEADNEAFEDHWDFVPW